MNIQRVTIYQGNGCFPGTLRLPDAGGPAPAVAFSNGYCAYSEMYDGMADALCAAGFVTLQYDGRGTSGQDRGRFLCGTEWLEDLGSCVAFLSSLPQADPERIGLAGVSMGGALTIMQGAVDPRVRCLFAMAPVYSGRELIETPWRRSRGDSAWEAFRRRMFADAARTAQGFPSEYVSADYGCGGTEGISEASRLEAEKHPGKALYLPLESLLNCYLYVNTIDAVRRVRAPLCIVHGTADATVPCRLSGELLAAAGAEHKALRLLPDRGHVLPEEACGEVSQLAADWFGRWL